jgi:RNA polymerase sigma factor (sigma-70 family)
MVGIQELLERARTGDLQAWDSLHTSLQPYLLRQAQNLLGPDWPERSVSDLMQDTWLRAMKKFNQFASGPDDLQTAALLRAWLKKIMRSLHINLIRDTATVKRRPQSPLVSLNVPAFSGSSNGFAYDVPGRDLTASKTLSQSEEQARVRSALAGLPELEREIIRLHVLDNVPMPEIATRLSLTYETVRYRKNEALRLLGEELNGTQG